MINNLNDFWNQVFERLVTVNGDHNLEELFSKFEDATLRDIVEDDEIINTAFTAFKKIISNTLPFLAQYQLPEVPPEDNHVQITATLIKTVLSKRKVDAVSMEDTFRQMAALFVVISALGLDWNKFPKQVKEIVNDNFLKVSANVLKCYSFKLRSKNTLTTDWKKLKDLYEEGLVEQNFKKIYSFISAVCRKRGLFAPEFIRECTRFLAWADFDKLSMIINCKVDTVIICRLLQNLNDDKKLMLCLNTTNPLVQFECIRQVSSKNNQSLDQTDMMTQCLVKLSQEPNFWHQFLSYFNIGPSKYPSLQKPLGKALAQMEEDKLREYVAVMKINELHISRRQISECLTAFCEKASEDKKTFLFGEIFQEWNGFIEKSLKCCLTGDKEFSLNVSANEIFYTDFIGVVVAHISTFSQTKISEEIETLINKLNSVRTEKWFESGVLQERFFYVLLSKLFVHSLAWKKKGCHLEKQDQLYTSLKNFTDNKHLRYLFHLYRVNKKTLKLIGVMRKNFSL